MDLKRHNIMGRTSKRKPMDVVKQYLLDTAMRLLLSYAFLEVDSRGI